MTLAVFFIFGMWGTGYFPAAIFWCKGNDMLVKPMVMIAGVPFTTTLKATDRFTQVQLNQLKKVRSEKTWFAHPGHKPLCWGSPARPIAHPFSGQRLPTQLPPVRTYGNGSSAAIGMCIDPHIDHEMLTRVGEPLGPVADIPLRVSAALASDEGCEITCKKRMKHHYEACRHLVSSMSTEWDEPSWSIYQWLARSKPFANDHEPLSKHCYICITNCEPSCIIIFPWGFYLFPSLNLYYPILTTT